MKKGIKIFLIIFAILAIAVLADTIQAKAFDNNPLIKIRYSHDGGNVDYVDKGIFVYTYVFTNGEKVTVFRWEKYAPPEELVDLETNKEQAFFGKVVESNGSHIIVEPNENEEIRKSSDKIDIGLGEYNDMLYVVGTNVKVTYNGVILESYPAQIKDAKIEIKSVDKFGLVFYQKTAIRPKQKEIIISKGEIKDLDYNVYAYEGHVAINLNSESTELTENSISLRDALLQNKITMEEIIAKANKDFPNTISYDDGGSMEYHYDNYTIIKVHNLNGNRDVYIGTKDMTINDLENLY